MDLLTAYEEAGNSNSEKNKTCCRPSGHIVTPVEAPQTLNLAWFEEASSEELPATPSTLWLPTRTLQWTWCWSVEGMRSVAGVLRPHPLAHFLAYHCCSALRDGHFMPQPHVRLRYVPTEYHTDITI